MALIPIVDAPDTILPGNDAFDNLISIQVFDRLGVRALLGRILLFRVKEVVLLLLIFLRIFCKLPK